MTQPVIAIALHDGWYGAGTGAGRSNRALLTAITRSLAPGVHLLLLPVHLDPASNEYDPDWHHASRELLADIPHQIQPVDNGTCGRSRFGDVHNFAHLAADTARHVTPIMTSTSTGALIAIDLPFVDLATHLPESTPWQLLYLPRSTTTHHPDPDDTRHRFERHGITNWARRGARIAAISSHMRRHLADTYNLPHHRIVDIPGGLTAADIPPTTPRRPLPAQAEHGFALAMGRAQPYKGFDDLLTAWTTLRDAGRQLPHLLLAAVTETCELTSYQQHLATRIHTSRLDATLLTRYDPHIPDWLRHPALRAVIVPSHIEPLGRIPLEAFAAHAAPVIATTAGGLAETVLDGTTGYTCPPANPPALATAISRALDADATTIEQLRAAGAQLAASRDYTTCVTRAVSDLAPWALTKPSTGMP